MRIRVMKSFIAGVAMAVGATLGAAQFNVADFGADGTDALSDRAAFQAALDKARGASETTVVNVPAGTYYMDRSMFIYSNTRLQLDEGAVIVRKGSTDQVMLFARHLLPDGTECPADSSCTHGGRSQFENIVVQGGTWDASSSATEVTGIFKLCHGRGVEVSRAKFKGTTDHVLNFSGSADVTVIGCTFSDMVKYTGSDLDFWGKYAAGDAARYDTIECVHLDFTDEEGELGNYPMDGTACENVVVSGCVFDGVFAGVGNHHALVGRFATGLRVTGCTFNHLQSYGVYAFGMKECVVDGCESVGGAGLLRAGQASGRALDNTVKAGTEDGFFFINGADFDLWDNIVESPARQGVNLVGATVRLSDNTIKSPGDCGIRADAASTVSAWSNTVASPVGYGFSFTGGSSLLAVSNALSSCGKSAFCLVSPADGAKILDNVVDGTDGFGVQVEGADDLEVWCNTLKGVKSHGIGITTCYGAGLVGNRIVSPSGHGVYVSGGTASVCQNGIESAGKNGIHLENGARAYFTAGNDIRSAGGRGVCVLSGSSANVDGNTIADSTNEGIRVESVTDSVLANNRIDGGNGGIWCASSESVDIRGNVIAGSTARGICVTSSTGCSVARNAVTDSVQEGVYFRESTGGTIEGNRVRGTGGIGISVSGTETAAVSAAVLRNDVTTGPAAAWDIRIWGTASGCALQGNACGANGASCDLAVYDGGLSYVPADARTTVERNGDGSLSVSWERLAPINGYPTAGYIVEYAKSSDFASCGTREIGSSETVSCSIPSADAAGVTHVRVRSYQVYYYGNRHESAGNVEFTVELGRTPIVLDETGGVGDETERFAIWGETPTAIQLPKKKVSVFDGYWTEPLGGGEELVNAAGAWTKPWDRQTGLVRLFAKWKTSVAWDEESDGPVPSPVAKPEVGPAPVPSEWSEPDPDPEPDPVKPDPDPVPDPEPTAPELFSTKASKPFGGNATYVGWVRDANGAVKGTLTVKAGKPAKATGQSKLTISYIPFGGKKQNIKLEKSEMPVADGMPTVDIPGLGPVKFGGDSLAGVGFDVQAGPDLTKSSDRDEKARAKARLAAKAGAWTFALETPVGYAAFSVTVSNKGKGKLSGALPDGTKVSVSVQGVLGEHALAVPFLYSKKGSVGFIFWVDDDGTVSISDLTRMNLASGASYEVKAMDPASSHRLSDGVHAFSFGDVVQEFEVAGRKWIFPKQNKRLGADDPNPFATKLTFTEKTGAVKGSFTVIDPSGRKVKYTVTGMVVGDVMYGTAANKTSGSLSVIAK